MSRGRVLLAVNDFPPILGGEARLYHALSRHLPPDEIVVWAPRHPDAATVDTLLPCEVRRGRIPAHGGTPSRLARSLLGGAHLAALALAERPRYFVCGQILSLGGPVHLLARALRVPYAVFVHGADIADYRRSPLCRPVLGRILAGADTVVANSRFTAALVEEIFPGRARRIVVLPMGVDLPEPADPSTVEALRRRYRVTDGPVLLTMARLAPVKGHETVLKALPRLLPGHPGLRYLVVGEGPERRRLETLAREHGVQPQVIFAGAVPDAERTAHFALATLFAMPSRRLERYDGLEGFGLVFLEAASHGLASIGGASGGVSEAIRHGETGLLVPPDDPAAFAEAADRLLRDPAARRRLGETARLWAAQHPWSRSAEALRALWNGSGAEALTTGRRAA
jgi:phosphatidylinositol alpha-1,6-mannosyltransferase